MRKRLLLFSCLFVCALSGFSQIGIGTATPDSSAILDLWSQNKGFLPPRISLTGNNIAAPVVNPAIGLLIYNTATAGAGTTAVVPGYYYWNGTQWYPTIPKGNAPGDMQYWDGSRWVNIPVGANGSVLTLCNGVPRWGGCPDTTINILPASNPYEVFAYSYTPTLTGFGDTQLTIGAWTVEGSPVYYRVYLKFDVSIPPAATIKSAKLSLYAMPNPHGGNMQDAHYGVSNALYLQRITGPWISSNVTWYNQPLATPANQVTIPNSTSAFQDNVDIDVTQLVQDMQQNGNYGFALKLATENFYNIRQYASSFNSNPAKRPRLVITYNP